MRTLLLTLALLGCDKPSPDIRPDGSTPEPSEGLQFVQDGRWDVEWGEGSDAPWTGCDALRLDDEGTTLEWCDEAPLEGDQRDYCRCFPHWLEGERDWCVCPGVQSLTADIHTDGAVVASFRARLE